MYKIARRCILFALFLFGSAYFFPQSKWTQSFLWFYPMVILAAIGLLLLIIAFFKGELYGESLFFPIILPLVSLALIGYSILLLFYLSVVVNA